MSASLNSTSGHFEFNTDKIRLFIHVNQIHVNQMFEL